MGKMRRFLAVFVSLFIIAIAGNAHAAGYTCDDIKQYTSCAAGRYLNSSNVGNNCNSLCSETRNNSSTSVSYSGTRACTGNYTGGPDNNTTVGSSACTGCSAYTCTCPTTGTHITGSGSTCNCAINTFNVAYNAGGGTGSAPTSPTSCTYNGTCNAPSNTYTRANYTFTGWKCTSSSGSCASSTYAPGASISKATTVNGATITLTAQWMPNVQASASTKTLTYNGSTPTNGTAQSCANVSVTAPSSGYTIKYGTSAGTYNMTSAPTLTNVGTTTVYYQVTATGYQPKTGYYTCKMNTKSITVTAGTKTLTYNGSTPTNGTAQSCANVSVTMPTSGSGATIKYGTSAGTYNMSSAPTLTTVGSTTVHYQVTANNFTTKTGSYTCTMNSKAMTVSAQNKSLTYNGSAQSCGGTVSVTVPSSDANITYSTTSSGTYSATAPTMTNVSESPKTIYYKVTASNFTTKTGSYTCTMDKAACTMTISPTSGSTAYPNTKTFTVNNAKGTVGNPSSSAPSVATASISGTTVTITPASTGTTTISVTDPGNSNYNGCTKSYSLTVNAGTITVSAPKNSKTYDGNALTCSVSSTTPSGTTVKYKTSEGGTYASTVPTITNAGKITVYYQASKSNYTTKTGSFECEVTRAPGSISAIADQTLTYPTTKTISVTRAGNGTVYASSDDTNIVTVDVSGTTLTLTPKKAGTAMITVDAAQGTNHFAASIQFNVTVNRGTCSVTLSRTSSTVTYPTNPATFTATTTGNGGLSVSSSKTSVATATISSGTVTPKTVGAGDATITVKAARTDQYNECSTTHAIKVNKAAGLLELDPTSGSIAYLPGTAASTTFSIKTNKSGGALSLVSSNTNVTAGLGADNKTVTVTSNGKVVSGGKITVTSAATGNYTSATADYMINVTCGTGYYSKSGTCTACPENAIECGGSGNPDGFSCEDGYHKNADGDACLPNEYTVTYACGDGSGTPPAETTKPVYNASAGYTPKANTCTAPAGHDFAGWLVSGTSDIRDAGTKFIWKYLENKTFTAQWNPKNSFTATYSCGDGTGTPPARDSNITFGANYTVKANGSGNCSRTGYTFAGWSDGSATVQPGVITWNYSSSKTFTAVWSPKCLKITVNSQSATTNAAPATVYLKYATGWYSNSACTTAISEFTTKAVRTGYTLGGFYTAANGGGVQVANATGNGTFLTTNAAKTAYTADGTMYAKWTANTYNISYTLNSGTQATSGVPTQYTYGVGATINGKPTRSEYLFGGWCTDSGLSSCAMTQTIGTTATGNKTFYAKWNGCPANATCENNEVTCNHDYDWDPTTNTCVRGTLDCVEGKYYPGTGTEMVDCKKENGWYCPGTGSTGIDAGPGCRVMCPTGKPGGVLSTSVNGATKLEQCVESLTGVEIPKNATTKNGTADTVCGYTGIVDGVVTYEQGCTSTVRSCIAGYYVPIKDESTYSKQGYCAKVENGYYRAGGACNANPTSANDTCMRNKCPNDGATKTDTSSQIKQCYTTCSTQAVMDNGERVGTKTPVTTELFHNGTSYPSCTYNVTCVKGYEKVNDGTATATCEPNIYTVTLDANYDGGTDSTIYAKYKHGWYSDVAAQHPITSVSVLSRANFTFDGYQDADDTKIINADGTFAVAKPTFTGNTTLTAIWHGIPVACVKGKYYTGVGTTMAPCRSGEYCPGEGNAYQGSAGCYIKCPKSAQNGTLSSPTSTDPNGTGATMVSQCQEKLTNVQIPTDSADKNGVADSVCGYTSGTNGNAIYKEGCLQTVKSCIAGYYVPIKDESTYSKQGYCEAVGKGYYRAAGTCNANPTQGNDTCMRNKCPGAGTTSGTISADANACYIECQREDIIVSGKKVGSKNPVMGSDGTSRAWLIAGTTNYNACHYNASCSDGYVAQPENSEAGSVNPTCVVGAGWSITYVGENDIYTLPGSPIRNFTVETVDRTLPTNVLRTGYTFAGWYENPGLTGTRLTTIPADRLSALTLYAAWTPNVYPVTVDSANGTATKVIYMKYATGWYSNAAATAKIDKLDIPSGSGDKFGGYYYPDKNGVQVVNSEGTFMTNTLEPADNMKIVAKWVSQPIQCPAGTYYPGNGDISNCTPCESGYYCEGKTQCDSNDGNICGRSECPEFTILSVNISSEVGASNKTQCRKSNVTYVSDANHVKSGLAKCPANADGAYEYDAAKCTDHSVSMCVAGYYRTASTAEGKCEAVGKGWWSDGNGTSRTQCESRTINTYASDGVEPVVSEQAGTTSGTTSTSAKDCYLDQVPFTPVGAHGKGTQTCKWDGFGDYSDECTNKIIRYCDAGYYRATANATECIPAGPDRFSTAGSLISELCPARTDAYGNVRNGETAKLSDPTETPSGKIENATSAEACMLRVSYEVPHGTGTKLCSFSTGSDKYDLNCDDMVITSCEGGYYRPMVDITDKSGVTTKKPATDACIEVGENHYRPAGVCTGAGDTDTCMRIACPDNGLASGNTNTSVTACYKQGLEYTSEANHVASGTQTCNATSLGAYTDKCRDWNVTKCVAGYYRTTETDAKICIEVGTGYWSDGTGISRTQCEIGMTHVYSADGTEPTEAQVRGTTAGTTSVAATECYLEMVPYVPTDGHGKGTQTCKWDGFAAYGDACNSRKIRYCDAGYYRSSADATACVPAGLNHYSPKGSLDTVACPARQGVDGTLKNGETITTTASSPKACLLRVPYDVPHGAGTKLCEFSEESVNHTTGEVGQYDINCKDYVITACDGGYYRPIVDGTAATEACVEVGKNYYRPAGACTGTGDSDTCMRIACPAGGLTVGTTSESSTACYLERLACPITNGAGQNTCHHNGSDNMTIAAYNTNCTTCLLTECDDGYSHSDNMCIACPANKVCSGNSETTCDVLTGGKYTKSDPGTSDVSGCYRDCALGEHATAMTGRDYYGNNQCEIAACESGYILSGGKCQICPPGHYCPTDNPDDQMTCPAGWSNSDGLAIKKEDCYRTCESYPIVGGTAVPVAEKAFWDSECEFKGVSDNGNECEIVDGECVETSCRSIYEMIDGVCVPCNREHALSYLPKGNCMVASCEIGYHPKGTQCEYDVKSCSVPHAVRASQKWDSKLNSFSTCQVEECEDGYHIASNACVADEQVCAVEHGVGIKEWNHRTNSWGECVATSCDAGYTNDPSETNELSKQCGQCKNKFSILGEVAASTYIRGCEIATCLYQGELYNLENNECVPICEVNGYEDETGTRKWDPSRKKCVRNCKAGYTMW